ncbi:MORC family CW-type zinc finger protein 1-like [Sapajus apella]|uniref:MORC family CW-type zinc finger protein 1-like n=1 Tax=Sapajus apella TaxID=9515 RepID=A0A6J3F7H7_SAPAP|nr:MORC family CW-type zinc finger protein 1-like [Sapajus apella]
MSSQSTSVKEPVRKLMSKLRETLLYFFPEYQLPSELEEPALSCGLEQCPEQINKKLKMCFNQIQNTCMAQYEKKLKRKIQSVIYDSNTRGIHNLSGDEKCLCQCHRAFFRVIEYLEVKGGPESDREQIDTYLEALLKEDNLLFQNN